MSPHSDTLSGFRADQSLLFLLNAACLVEKQQIPIGYSLNLTDRGSNLLPVSTALEPSSITITSTIGLILRRNMSESLNTNCKLDCNFLFLHYLIFDTQIKDGTECFQDLIG